MTDTDKLLRECSRAYWQKQCSDLKDEVQRLRQVTEGCPCSTCDGTGKSLGGGMRCPDCLGSGRGTWTEWRERAVDAEKSLTGEIKRLTKWLEHIAMSTTLPYAEMKAIESALGGEDFGADL